MRGIFKLVVFTVLLIIPACASQTGTSQAYEPEGQVSVDLFYQQLSPYGLWINYPPYGRVWVPDVGWNFSPYATSGQWMYTSYGWTWDSYYSWGWAPFHYGRWFYDGMFGWIWVPDTVWAPAWVVWSTGGGYCGWAPLGPRVSLNLVVNGRYSIPQDHWVFVREGDLSNSRISRYRVRSSQNRELLNNAFLVRETRQLRQATYAPGPKQKDFQNVARPDKTNDFRDRNRSEGDRFTKRKSDNFSPDMKSNDLNSQRRSPKNEVEMRDLRTPQERQDRDSYRGKSREYSARPNPPERYPDRNVGNRKNEYSRGKKGG